MTWNPRSPFVYPEALWEPQQTISVTQSGGPERVDTSKRDKPEPVDHLPVGFTQVRARIVFKDEVEPLLWEGDQA